jgi:hypothetical protein
MGKKGAKASPAAYGSRCIICGLEKDGLEVKEDYVINAMRYFKKNITKNAKNYRLVVCKECFPKYDKARNSYVKKQISYVAIAVAFAVLLIIVAAGNLGAIVYGLAIIIFMYLLSLLSYTPGVKMPPNVKPPKVGRK